MAEAEVYRQTLKLEIQNLRIYGIKTKRRMTSLGGNPILALGIPMLASWTIRKRRVRRWGTLAFLGWQLYHRFGPMLVQRFASTGKSRETAAKESPTEAEEYLSKRI